MRSQGRRNNFPMHALNGGGIACMLLQLEGAKMNCAGMHIDAEPTRDISGSSGVLLLGPEVVAMIEDWISTLDQPTPEALGGLDFSAMSQDFRDTCFGLIPYLWAKDRATAVYVAMCLQRHLRMVFCRSREVGNLLQSGRFTEMIASLRDSERLLYMLQRLREISIGLTGENLSWPYLNCADKRHWCWLVHQHIVDDSALTDAFIQFAMTWIPREPYLEIEPLLAALADDANRWDAIATLAESAGGTAMLRAGSLHRRKRLGRHPILTNQD